MQKQSIDNTSRDYYSKAEFWDERYVQKNTYFDWYAQYPQLKYCFQNQYGMSKQDWILMVGCGNSKLSQQMYQVGYKNIVNIDISPVVIQQMKKNTPQLQWLVMDATNMTFEDKKFDYVIDKGTMDALIAGRDLSPTIKLLKECMRVTKEQGQLILITYGSPEGRKKIFESSLTFDQFDYYFTYVNLSDMSTMINLMRNNLIGKNGEQVSKQQALQRSMKQFMMIKIMRQRRSKQKQFIIWQNFMKKIQTSQHKEVDSEIKEKKIQSKEEQKNEKQKAVQKESKKEQNVKQNEKQDEKQDQKQEEKSNVKQKENDNEEQKQTKITYISKPQKQSYVYAYSIKRKFGHDLNITAVINQQGLQSKQENPSVFQGNPQLSTFQFKSSQATLSTLNQCINYCLNKKISYSTVTYIPLNHPFSTDSNSIKLNFSHSQVLRINILTKTNIDLFISYQNLHTAFHLLKNLKNYLLQQVGIELHPCPKTYALFTMIKSKMKAKSSNQLLQMYWYPTFSISSIDTKNNQMNIKLSIPPVLDVILDKVKQKLIVYFQKGSQNKVQILKVRKGFITFPELNLFSIINMASLSHNNGKGLEICMQDFWQKNIEYSEELPSKLFRIRNTQLQITAKLLPFIILNLISLY